MRRIFTTLITLTISALSLAQSSLPLNDQGRIEYTEVVTTDGLTAKELYSKAKLFITNVFVSGKDVTQLTDEASTTVVADGLIPVNIGSVIGVTLKADVKMKLTVQCKDGRYKYTANSFQFVYTPDYGNPSFASLEDHKGVKMTKKQWESVNQQTDDFVKKVIAELKKAMVESKSDNW